MPLVITKYGHQPFDNGCLRVIRVRRGALDELGSDIAEGPKSVMGPASENLHSTRHRVDQPARGVRAWTKLSWQTDATINFARRKKAPPLPKPSGASLEAITI